MRCLLTPWPHPDWASTATASHGWTWIWMDLNGTTTAKVLPDQPILTSWLWGWRPSHWVRLRIDGTAVIGSSLLDVTDRGKADPVGLVVDTFPTTITRIAPPIAGDVDPLTRPMITLHEVLMPPLTFLELPACP